MRNHRVSKFWILNFLVSYFGMSYGVGSNIYYMKNIGDRMIQEYEDENAGQMPDWRRCFYILGPVLNTLLVFVFALASGFYFFQMPL